MVWVWVSQVKHCGFLRWRAFVSRIARHSQAKSFFYPPLDIFLLPFFLFHLLTIRSVLFFLSREIKRRDNHTWVKSFNECLVPGFQAMSYLCRDCSSDAQLSGTVGRTSPVGVICLGSTLNPTLASTSASNGNVKCFTLNG